MAGERDLLSSVGNLEFLQTEPFTPQQFIDILFDATHRWVETQTDAKILADFEEERVTNWEHTPDTREAGLGPGSWSDFDLQKGFIAQVGDAYIGVAAGEGYRNYFGSVPRLQFGFHAMDTYRPYSYYSERLKVVMKSLRGGGRSAEWREELVQLDKATDFTPNSTTDLAKLVRNGHDALSGEVIIDDMHLLRVSSELDAVCNGGVNLRRWPQERILTQEGLRHAQLLIQRVKKHNAILGSEPY